MITFPRAFKQVFQHLHVVGNVSDAGYHVKGLQGGRKGGREGGREGGNEIGNKEGRDARSFKSQRGPLIKKSRRLHV